ncbi:MAG: CAP domain-containing protein [Planctomycetota bacterium]
MGHRIALATLLTCLAALWTGGCGGGAPLAEAQGHLAAGRLERAAELLAPYEGRDVAALRALIEARASERAAALARLAALEAGRADRTPAEVLADLRTMVAEARDPVVHEQAEVALSNAHDWAAEWNSAARRKGGAPEDEREGRARDAGNQAGRSGDAAAGGAAAGRLGAGAVAGAASGIASGIAPGIESGALPGGPRVAPKDPIAAAALREFEGYVEAKDWRSALVLAERWAAANAVEEPVRAAFDTWRAAAIADAVREADDLVVRAWRLDQAGDRGAAIELLAAAVERFPEAGSTGGVARALDELRGDSSFGSDRAAPGAERLAVADTPDGTPAPRDASAQASTGQGLVDAGQRDGVGRVRNRGGAEPERDARNGRAQGADAEHAPATEPRPEAPSPTGEELRTAARTKFQDLRDRLVAAGTALERDAVYTEFFVASKAYSEGRELLAEALEARFQAALARLERVGSLKRLEKVAEQRQKLDTARKDALALIFDEQRYFYPYRPPEVPAAKAATYPAVQREVDELVDAVASVWDQRASAKIPELLRRELPELGWLRRRAPLARGKLVFPPELPAWVEGLPIDADAVDLASFAWTVDEAYELARSRAICARNEAVWAALDGERNPKGHVPDRVEREQVRVTNAYRAMFGRRALAWNSLLHEAASGHSDYMSRTGDFGHYEPTAERHSPFDRMGLVGYSRGVSENCHMGSGDAEGAHRGWRSSSGHHRNLLMAGHREMASAVDGGYWTQNFGLDTSFEQHLDLSGWRD